MNVGSAGTADTSGVLVISAWQEGSGPLVLRITTSLGEGPETSRVTSSVAEAEAAVRSWLEEFEECRRLLG